MNHWTGISYNVPANARVVRKLDGPPPKPLKCMAEYKPCPKKLTARQGDVYALLAQGLSNKEIQRTLNLTEGTIKVHVHGILQYLRVGTRAKAIAAFYQQKLVVTEQGQASHGA